MKKLNHAELDEHLSSAVLNQLPTPVMAIDADMSLIF